MSLPSFYGGKQGLSSIIKKSFKYISTADPAYAKLPELDKDGNTTPGTKKYARENHEIMENCFQDVNFKEVWYGELCIIDSYNKNNPANGCLFRRTLIGQGSNYPIEIFGKNAVIGDNSGKLSAEYIGQIVGPKSATPYLGVGSLEKVNELAREDFTTTYEERVFEVDSVTTEPGTEQDNIAELHYDEILDSQDSIFIHDAIDENIFVSGKECDEITYSWYNVRKNSNNENNRDAWMYLGFQIPYLQIDWNFPSTDFYVTPTATNAHDLAGSDPKKFYQDWTIDIPRGVRGNAASVIELTTLNKLGENVDVYPTFDSIIEQIIDENTKSTYYQLKQDATPIDAQFFIDNVIGSDVTQDTEYNYKDVPFFVYKYTIYNDFSHEENAAGHTVYIYMGNERSIKNFTLSNDGVVTVHYNTLTKQDLNCSIPWIDTITINSPLAAQDAGLMTITYNNKNLPDGKQDFTFNLGLVYKAVYDDGTGKTQIFLTNGENFYIQKKVEEGEEPEDFQFIYPKKIELLGDISPSGDNESLSREIKVTTNLTGTQPQSMGSPINYVQDIVISEDLHLCVLFNDPTHRTPNWGDVEGDTSGDKQSAGSPDLDGIYWRKGLIGSHGETFDNVYWRDYGLTVKHHDKLYVGHCLDFYQITDPNDPHYNEYKYTSRQYEDVEYYVSGLSGVEVLDVLQAEWPKGFSQKMEVPNTVYPETQDEDSSMNENEYLDMRGMIVGAAFHNGETNKIEITYFYAYNYDKVVMPDSSDTTRWIEIAADPSVVDVMIDELKDDYVFYMAEEGTFLNVVEMEASSDSDTLVAPWITDGEYDITAYTIKLQP